jgi:hypothetical protein
MSGDVVRFRAGDDPDGEVYLLPAGLFTPEDIERLREEGRLVEGPDAKEHAARLELAGVEREDAAARRRRDYFRPTPPTPAMLGEDDVPLPGDLGAQ